MKVSFTSLLSRSFFALVFTLLSVAGWGQTVNTYNFTSAKWQALPDNWVSGKDGSGFSNTQGLQIATGATGAFANSPISFTNVSKVVVVYSTNSSAGVGSIRINSVTSSSALINSGTQIGSTFSITKPSAGGTTDKIATFTPASTMTGFVQIVGTCTTNSIYIKSIEITNETGPPCSPPTPSFIIKPDSEGCPEVDRIYETQPGKSNYDWKLQKTAGVDYTVISGGTSTDNKMTVRFYTKGGNRVTVGYSEGICKSVTPAISDHMVNGVSISPVADQSLPEGASGTQLHPSEDGTIVSREWKFGTTPTGLFSSFSTPETNFYYTPSFASAGTYYVVCETAFAGCNVISNPVKIIVTALGKPVINSNPTKSTVYGTADTYQITATNSPTSYTVISPATLPVGFTFNNTTGKLSAVDITDAGTYSFKFTATNSTGASNEFDFTWTVLKKNLTVSGIPTPVKFYDQSTTATLNVSSATLTGVIGADAGNVSVSSTGYTAIYNNKDAATGKPITVTNLGLTGSRAYNYVLTQPSITGNISPKGLSITAPTIAPKSYDSFTTTGTISVGVLSGFIGTETVTASATGNYTDPNVGTNKPATVNYVLADGSNGGLAINYSLGTGTGTGDINAIAPTLGPNPININVGASAQISSSSSVTPTYTSADPTIASVDVNGKVTGVAIGTTTISVSQNAGGNYTAGTATITVNVSSITYVNGDFRSTSNGTWQTATTGTATWEIYTGTGPTGWESQGTRPGINATQLGTKTVYIKNEITLAGNNTAPNVVVLENGKLFTSTVQATFGNLLVKSYGEFYRQANGSGVSGTFEVEDNGFVYFYHTNNTSRSTSIWAGTEKFHTNSNFVIKSTDNSSNFQVIQANDDVSEYNGGCFGNLIIDQTAGNSIQLLPSGFNKTLTKGNLIFRNAVNDIRFLNSEYITTIGGNFEIESTFTGRKINLYAGGLGTSNITINGNLIHKGNDNLNLNTQTGSILNLNLKGNLEVASTGKLIAANENTSTFNFVGANSVETIDVANSTTLSNINFNINTAAYAKLINQDFTLGTNSKFNVLSGGTLDFGFDGSDKALNIKGNGTTGTGFNANAGSYLKITSPDGIMNTSGTEGNVQTNTAPVFSPPLTYHYMGRVDQKTGTGIGNTSNGKAVIVDLKSSTIKLTPSNSFGINNSNNANVNNGNGGILDIRVGRFVETVNEYITGTTGSLKMAPNTYYEIARSSADNTDFIPRISGSYEITGGEINLASTGSQILRGGQKYNDLTFSNGEAKYVSNHATPDIEGKILIDSGTVLNISGRTNNSFGKDITTLAMKNNSRFVLDGAAIRPQLGGYYDLNNNSEIEFTGSAGTQIRTQGTVAGAGIVNYAKVTVSGSNVTAGSTNDSGITFQNGGTFTVKETGVFKVPNKDGFTGTATSAIKNAAAMSSITLEPNSTVEYSRSNNEPQNISTLDFGTIPDLYHYQNLKISGRGVKSPANNLTVNNIISVIGGELKINATEDMDPPNVLTASKGIQVTEPGILHLENNANLLQDVDASNNGSIIADRNARLPRMGYTYWSAPVSGQLVYPFSNGGVTGGTPKNRFFLYDEATDLFKNTGAFLIDNNSVFEPALGYAIRGMQTFSVQADGFDTPATPHTFSFKGTPNNGNQPIDIKRTNSTHGYNLIGNPYPSVIHFDDLYSKNGNDAKMYATAYFWTNSNMNIYNTQQHGSNYDGNNYAIYNLTGGSPPAYTIDPDQPTVNTAAPDGTIKIGQGFIIRAKSKSTISFTNDMRNPSTGKFYNNRTNSTIKDRFWLKLTSPSQTVNTQLIGYINGATNDYEQDFDAEALTISADLFYSTASEKKLVIQGKAPFIITDKVLLGANFYENGNYLISLENAEGIFESGQNIYLKDNVTGEVTNLSQNNYNFAASKGDSFGRFEIIYKPEIVLSSGGVAKDEIIIYRDGENFIVKSAISTIDEIQLFDMVGRLVSSSRPNQKVTHIKGSSLADGVYVVKVKRNSQITVKKIIKD